MSAQVGNILDHKGTAVHAVSPDAPVSEAVRLMNQERIGSVLVVDDADALRGIVSERDVLHRVISEGRNPAQTRNEEIMTHRLWTVTRDTLIREALSLVTMARCRHLPVMEGERVVGLISLGDLTAWIVRELKTEIVDLHTYIHGSFSDRRLDAAQVAYEIQAIRSRGNGISYPTVIER
jgi:signal-transduction protein with cAMP-binding, CBS, and nucleotidyltransferase domain